MMEHMTVNEILKAVGGRLLCGNKETPVEHISIDSRTMKGNDLFVPLIGEKVDAHLYLDQAIQNGAAAVFTSRHQEPVSSSAAWIYVTDTRQALQDVGRYYRNRLHLPLVGVTGSVGKTTTREMISAALSAGYRVYKTPGNHNSQVGVPITLSEISAEDEIGVIELGMSEPGELTVIAQLAQVDMAVITNIGVTHMEQLGSQENILREKLSIQDGMKPGGILFLNGDDKWLRNSAARDGFSTVYYGTGEACDYRAVDIVLKDGYPSFTAVHGGDLVNVTLKVMGMHQVLNAMVSLAVADVQGVPLKAAAAALSEFTGFENRQQIYEDNGITYVDDTYNASPASMKAAIDILVSIQKKCQNSRRIAVLADMKELGTDAGRFHYEIGTYLVGQPVEIIATYGELADEIAKGAVEHGTCSGIYRFVDRSRLEQWLETELKAGDYVLFKGSNSMKLGEVIEHVRQYHH